MNNIFRFHNAEIYSFNLGKFNVFLIKFMHCISFFPAHNIYADVCLPMCISPSMRGWLKENDGKYVFAYISLTTYIVL